MGETLDPERLRGLLATYFEQMKTIVERHGGTVEKFIGDAVMAVFGVPVVHEDDALRAVRAALEMRDALPGLGLVGRIGVMTGEVVTGTAERLATGDAVNVAARLEQAAQPGEVLIGQPTFVLVEGAADVEPIPPLDLKGKAELVHAFRLLSVRDTAERRHDAIFVGRAHELSQVRDVWRRVQTERRCELLTIIGDAGVGKSRLVAEFLDSVDATVVRGRCLPYGEGITYWPVVEVLKQLKVLPPDEVAALAIRSLLGETNATTSADEIAWAFRKTLEHAAEQRPLVVVFDDIQWGEATFRDLIEHVALLSSGASILLLCNARPDLVERQPTWPVTLRLEPLDEADVEELLPGGMAPGLRGKIARAAGGNPLFIQEMVAMAHEVEGEVVVPPTLQALLAARLDQLETGERGVLERGSIEGEIFHRGAVQALASDELQVTARLAALVRKELIRPNRPQFAREDGFRFRHLLIRDAAYDALPKAVRADLHHRLAKWLEEHGTELVELDEILGYHLEQTCRYRGELGLSVDPAVAEAARRRLTAGGRRAQLRSDYAAAVSLYERAAGLVPQTEVDLVLETQLGDALFWGARPRDALRRAEAMAERASATGDQIGELCGRIRAGMFRTYLEPEGAAENLSDLIEQALPVFEAAGHEVALNIAYGALGHIGNIRGQMDASRDAFDRADAAAQQEGLPEEYLGWRASARLHGTTAVLDLLAWLNDTEARGARSSWLRDNRAGALAMLGRFEEARAILAEIRSERAERGGGVALASLNAGSSVELELLAGDPEAAAEFGAEGCRQLTELGEQSILSTAAGMFAEALYALDRLEEADIWASRGAELGASDDAMTQMFWRRVRAKVLARRGEHVAAEELAREAVAVSEATDMLNAQGDVYADFAEVLFMGGRATEAAVELERAIGCYQRKGNLVSTARAQTRLAELEAGG
jgi:tetratricopeptide (TPR) repeat protein/xanthosine utilization system XapX-like protein